MRTFGAIDHETTLGEDRERDDVGEGALSSQDDVAGHGLPLLAVAFATGAATGAVLTASAGLVAAGAGLAAYGAYNQYQESSRAETTPPAK